MNALLIAATIATSSTSSISDAEGRALNLESALTYRESWVQCEETREASILFVVAGLVLAGVGIATLALSAE